MLSNAFRSLRMSVVTGLAPGGGAAAALEDCAAGTLGAGAAKWGSEGGARTVTVSPRPSIPLSSKGWMPYATRNWCGA
jgi:hypothetical protein